MFNFLKKKIPFSLNSPVDGTLTSIDKVNDPVFSKKMMGDGFAVKPEGENISVFAPTTGTLVSLPETKHAFGITTSEGIDILVHIGLDTVNLNGEGFKTYKKQGQKVKKGEKIVSFKESVLKKHNLDNIIMTIFTGGYNKKVLLKKKYGTQITSNDLLIS